MGRNYSKEDLKAYKFYRYKLPEDWEVIAGKTDIDNDYLSIKLANANDYWFHVKGMPGSHVVLRAKENEEPEKFILEMAASIAVYHSKGRNGGLTPVSYTLAKNVSKLRGAPPGQVVIKREKVIKVKPALPN